jgi:hypothetical protein
VIRRGRLRLVVVERRELPRLVRLRSAARGVATVLVLVGHRPILSLAVAGSTYPILAEP